MTSYQDKLYDLQKELWEYAEVGFLEKKSAQAMINLMRSEGFDVTENICSMETAFVGTYGSGKPVICLLAEYDALYGMSQQADIAEYCPDTTKETGHGCGHHLLGVGAIGAAMKVKQYLEENKLSGTIKMVGCPAEESGSGKAYLARDGFFDDADIALTWHPANYNSVLSGSYQSCIQTYFRFHGVSSHAASSPHLGRSALDAAELMSVGVNYLREHMESSDRVHYAYTDVGGKSPNVVQAEAEVKYLIRSTTNEKCQALYDRVINIAKGAALMSETTLEVVFDEGMSNVIPNFVLEDVLEASFKKIGPCSYSDEDRAYAKKFKDSYRSNVAAELPFAIQDKKLALKNMQESAINDIFFEHNHSEYCEMGSTDVGDVSWVVPTAQFNTACFAYGASAHSWQWVAQGKSQIALKGTLLAAEILADAAIACLKDNTIIEKAQAEFKERLMNKEYKCLIPDDIKPHII